ncbi:MAG: patatin-like phospholipase family protein [Rubrobacter sp.]|nr:patatin-like phospholipase family protein [Rubrobacter sp.]
MEANGNLRTAIVLQGGGALGAYEFGVLKALYERRPGFEPSVVTGISIGAITTAVLAGAKDDPIQALDQLWGEKLTVLPPLPPFFQQAYQQLVPTELQRVQEQFLGLVGNPGMYQPRLDNLYAPWLSTSVYDLAPLRQTLTELVDLRKLNNGGIRAAVGAIQVGTSLIKYFDNRNGGLSFERVMASGSLPPGFPMTEVDGHYYWDGGLFSNTPLGAAINRLEQCEPDNPNIRRELIVVELFPMDAPIPKDMPSVLNRMAQLQYTSRLRMDRNFFQKIDKMVDLLQKIHDTLPEDSPIRQDEDYKELRSHKKIDAFQVISAELPPELSNASDFSEPSIEGRIEAGYQSAIEHRIWEPTST